MNNTNKLEPTKEIINKLISLVDKGLVKGLGEQEPGKMCIEACVCAAFDLPHSDNPPCVGTSVRAFKIALNDKNWSSDIARAKGMKKLAVAQLGSDSLNQLEFSNKILIKICNQIIAPLFLKALPNSEYGNLFKDAKSFFELKSFAKNAADAAAAAADADAAADAAAADAAATANAAYAATANAAYAAAAYAAAAYAAATAATAATATAATAAAYAYAYADAAYAAADAAADDDAILTLAANLALEVLIEMKSPGCKWLYLCD